MRKNELTGKPRCFLFYTIVPFLQEDDIPSHEEVSLKRKGRRNVPSSALPEAFLFKGKGESVLRGLLEDLSRSRLVLYGRLSWRRYSSAANMLSGGYWQLSHLCLRPPFSKGEFLTLLSSRMEKANVLLTNLSVGEFDNLRIF